MNILLINYEFPPIGAGAATATYHIAKCLVRQGHEISVLTSSFKNLKGWAKEDGIKVFRCLSLRKKAGQSNLTEMFLFVLSAFLVLPKILREQKIDYMIIFFSFPCGPLGLWGKLISKTPFVISLRGGDVPGNEPSLELIHKFFKPLRQLIFRNSSAITANSKGLKTMSEKTDPFHVKIIPNGVDIDYFTPVHKENQRRIFLFVGRFRHQKNLFFLLANMDAVAYEHICEFELHLVGEGPLKHALQNYGDALKIRNQIFWHGWCGKEKLKQHYQRADCLLNPSFYEGMPNTVLEAMSCGLPVIASNVAGNNALVSHEETGFLFDIKHPKEFQSAVVQLFKNKELARTMGQKGRVRAEKEFSWSKSAMDYILVLSGKEGIHNNK